MVSTDKELSSQKIMAKFPAEPKYCKEFFSGGTVISLGRIECKTTI